jgi:Dullard-like phosphatase family protein
MAEVDSQFFLSSITVPPEFFYLQQLQGPRNTLVLDLDETLIHATFKRPAQYDFEVNFSIGVAGFRVYIQKRPGFDQFIQSIAFWFDVYIFTASVPEYAIPVVAKLIPEFPVSNILHRGYCSNVNGFVAKDLSIFERDLSHIILVDDSPMSFQLQPENGLLVPKWTGGKDEALMSFVVPVLWKCQNSADVREILRAE